MPNDSGPVILTFNFANMVTVVVMVALMYFLVGAIVRTLRERKQAQMAAA